MYPLLNVLICHCNALAHIAMSLVTCNATQPPPIATCSHPESIAMQPSPALSRCNTLVCLLQCNPVSCCNNLSHCPVQCNPGSSLLLWHSCPPLQHSFCWLFPVQYSLSIRTFGCNISIVHHYNMVPVPLQHIFCGHYNTYCQPLHCISPSTGFWFATCLISLAAHVINSNAYWEIKLCIWLVSISTNEYYW